MTFHDLIGDIALRLEKDEPTDPTGVRFIDRLRASCDSQYGTLNGHLVMQLLDRILQLLPHYDVNEKREAYNEFAASQGLSQLDQDDEDFDYWIHESLLDSVIQEIIH